MKKKAKPVLSTSTIVSTHSPFFDRFESHPLWHIIILIIIPFFIYIKTVGFELINWDDVQIIYNHLDILTHWSNIGIAFKTDIFLQPHGQFYRPIQTISFMLDAGIDDKRSLIYHLSNIIYHLLTVLSLYSVLRLLQLKNTTAFLFALFFAISPLLASAVSWVPARADILIGLWGILLLISFGKYLKSSKKAYVVFHALLFLLAAFTKETAVMFPILFLLYYFLVLKEKFTVKKILPFLIIWVIVLTVFFVMRNNIVTNALLPNATIGTGSFLDNLSTIPILLAKIFVPITLSPMPLFENTFIITGTLILLILLYIVIKKAISKQWLPAIGLIWFLIFLAPSLFYKLNDSQYILEYYQHWAYLPMIGIVIMLAALLDNKLQGSARSKYSLLMLTIIIIFIPIASLHSDDFKNSIAFFGRAAELNNPGASTRRGIEYFNQRDFNNAQNDFNKAVEISGGQYAPAYYYLGLTESQFNKKHDAAEADLTQAIFLDSSSIDAYISRADERISLQNISGAATDLAKAKILDSTNAKIYYIEGKANVATRNFPDAIEGFSKAISLDSFYTEAYNDRAFVYYQLKKYPEAINDCNKTISLNNSFFTAYYNKGMIYYETGQPDEAIKDFDSTLALANNLYFGYFYRGMAKKQKNDMAGACNDWQESVNLGFTMAEDTIKRYCK
jgi:tetratricopeptide (TPR) repeat protein